MKKFFSDKFEYSYTCNQKLIALVDANPMSYSDKIRTLISHTINAHNIWNHRIRNITPALGVWDVFEISELRNLDSVNYLESNEIINTRDLEEKVRYSNSEGREFASDIATILFHIINHSTYHRGQLISELISEGIDPIRLDYIFFKG